MKNEMLFDDDEVAAEFSPCRKYRYVLRRTFGHGRAEVMFLMLNPSTADEVKNDPTIRRCIGFAKSWGFSRLIVCNIFAYRSTDPMKLRRVDDPIGPDNDTYIIDCHSEAEMTICAWGVHGAYLDRGILVARGINACSENPVMCLGVTKEGHPKHPLYVPAKTEPVLLDDYAVRVRGDNR